MLCIAIGKRFKETLKYTNPICIKSPPITNKVLYMYGKENGLFAGEGFWLSTQLTVIVTVWLLFIFQFLIEGNSIVGVIGFFLSNYICIIACKILFEISMDNQNEMCPSQNESKKHNYCWHWEKAMKHVRKSTFISLPRPVVITYTNSGNTNHKSFREQFRHQIHIGQCWMDNVVTAGWQMVPALAMPSWLLTHHQPMHWGAKERHESILRFVICGEI